MINQGDIINKFKQALGGDEAAAVRALRAVTKVELRFRSAAQTTELGTVPVEEIVKAVLALIKLRGDVDIALADLWKITQSTLGITPQPNDTRAALFADLVERRKSEIKQPG